MMLSLLLNKCQSRVISIFIDVVIFGEFEGGFFFWISNNKIHHLIQSSLTF